MGVDRPSAEVQAHGVGCKMGKIVFLQDRAPESHGFELPHHVLFDGKDMKACAEGGVQPASHRLVEQRIDRAVAQ